jgi:hypothetical protein
MLDAVGATELAQAPHERLTPSASPAVPDTPGR